jgi:dTDP-4-dehydrorhamnose 3,5-epimerase
MNVIDTALPGVKLLEPRIHRDPRGFFQETYHTERYRACGVGTTFVQDNHSRSAAGTLRGLHLQVAEPQAKLIRVVAGAIFDVAVDVRVGSPTFGRWVAATLSGDNCQQLFIPEGFAHGFAVISEYADVEYKCSAFYNPHGEITIRYDEPAFAIPWPVEAPTLSARDASAPSLDAVRDRLPRYPER